MAKIVMEIELDYDADLMHGDDPEARRWFFDFLSRGRLILHENDEIGDDIGDVRVLYIVSGGPDAPALSKRSYQRPAGMVYAAAVVDAINAIADSSARRQVADALRECLLGVGDRPLEHPPYLFIRSDGYLEAQQH